MRVNGYKITFRHFSLNSTSIGGHKERPLKRMRCQKPHLNNIANRILLIIHSFSSFSHK